MKVIYAHLLTHTIEKKLLVESTVLLLNMENFSHCLSIRRSAAILHVDRLNHRYGVPCCAILSSSSLGFV